MYAAENRGKSIMLVKSDKPWGPFTDPVKTELGFDPGILVDDDGRVYAYWGFCESHAGELNDDMATLKQETVVHHLIGHCHPFWIKEDDGHVDAETGFFEASSPRKINGKYVLVYSKRYEYPREDLGVVGSCNGFLSYVWSDTPLGGFKRGGDISFNGGEIVEGPDGGIMKATNHSGGILGGISDGSDIIFRCAVKPTASISMLQQTVDKSGRPEDIMIKGRHDPVIVPRAVAVVEAMADLVIADALLASLHDRSGNIKSIISEV